MKLRESAARSSRSNTCLENNVTKSRSKQFVVCVNNDGHEVSLDTRKIYVALVDPAAAKLRMVRVIDESGDDYLYPKDMFRTVELPQAVKKALIAAA
jgi:hypothetical protein